jgi:hypothetical protein
MNINHVDNMGSNKLKLDLLLASYQLCSIVNFPTEVPKLLKLITFSLINIEIKFSQEFHFLMED